MPLTWEKVGRMARIAVLFTTLATALALLATPAAAADPVCGVRCDRTDPSQARSETFPVADRTVNGRVLRLHVSAADGMAWASIDSAQPNDAVWLDRSWDGGPTWDGLLGRSTVPGTWTGTRTLMYNLSDPSHHRRGMVRACGDGAGIACTDWAFQPVCAAACDGDDAATASGDSQPVPATSIGGRPIALHIDNRGMAWGTLTNGRAGDEVWLDRSFDQGASWPGGSSLGRVSVAAGATTVRTRLYNARDTAQWLYGGAVRACGRATESTSGSCTAWARPATDRASAAADALMYSYEPATAWWPSSWWNSAVAVETVADYGKRTGRTDFQWILDRTFTVNRVAFPAGGRSGDPIEGHFISRATDDAEWWALAWTAAYDLTKDQRYLSEAVTIANYVAGLWDSTCGGGVWWDRERTYKNAVTNGLYTRLTAELHNRMPGDSLWLGRARAAWNWMNSSGIINGSGLVNDGIDRSCRNNGGTVWTYNQGLAIGAAVEVWRATGDGSVLTRGRQLADAAINTGVIVKDGLLTEACDGTSSTCDDNGKQFKGIFMRYLMDLADATGSYRPFAQTQSDAVWQRDRDSLNRIGERWSGADSASYPNARDWRTQASGLSAILAAMPPR
jgi:predicted alpha-1,6-mannanase (GH76 family)